MDEFVETIQGEMLTADEGIEIMTAVVDRAYVNGGCTLIFPGQETASPKRYKCLRSAPLRRNDRVVLAKMSGTYVILGKLGLPAETYNFNKCPTGSSATAAACANWINSIIEVLTGFGFFSKNNW